MRIVTRSARVCSITAPLLIVTTSVDEGPAAEQLFGLIASTRVLGVFASTAEAGVAVDVRTIDEIAATIGAEIERVGAATVAIGLGLRGGAHLQASDAALLARRTARSRIAWLVYLDGGADIDAGRIARRRMQLFVRGIRLEPVALAEAPMGTTARFWEIRAPRNY